MRNTDATLRFGQRAFIFLDFDFKITTPLPTTKASELIAVGYSFKNFNKSPAIIKKLQGKIEYFPRGYPSLLDIENSPGREILTEIVFPESGPSGFPFNTPWEFRRNELEAAGSGIGHFYFFGRLTYLDVFNKERHTTWCRTFDPSTPLLAAGDCPWNNYD